MSGLESRSTEGRVMLRGKDGMRQLASALRDLPAWFEWDYKHPKNCALGFCAVNWDWSKNYGYVSSGVLCDHWGISMDDGDSIFFNFRFYECNESVTPEMVADQIEKVMSQ